MEALPRFDLQGKTALVTGAARGLGRAIALALAEAGADVALGLRDASSDSGVTAEVLARKRRALPLQMEMTRPEQIRQAVEDAVGHFGRLDILVNNAGIAPDNLAENVTEEDFDRTLAINLKGTFFACQAAGQVMIRQKSGCIINMSSQAAFAALPTESVYCMTKAGISHLTKCLAVEWGKHNITVNAVAPTFIHTPGTEGALADPAFRQDVVDRIAALHRIGEPVEVAGAVVFLASPAASLITGHTLVIDGGVDGPLMLSVQEQFGQIDIYVFDQILRGNIAAGMRVLDAGCGYGRNLVHLLREGCEIFAVDADPEGVEHVRQLSASLGARLPAKNFQVSLIEQMPFPEDFADVVICNSVLHFARDEGHFNAMLAELWRVLRPGGMLFCRLGSRIGMDFEQVAENVFVVGDGSHWFLVDEEMLLDLTEQLNGVLMDPLKTTIVQDYRCMTTWVLRKRRR